MDEMPTMKEMRRLAAEGKLTGPQSLFFRPTKPAEELYDTTVDPHEVQDLAGAPAHTAALEELRNVHAAWMKQVGDLGLVPEPELQARWRMGGVWSQTAAPEITSDGPSTAGTVTVRIACATEGASIAYTTETGRDARWKLYSKEITLTESAVLRVRAIRIGFLESAEVTAEFRL